jgi:calcium-dependent protein kinase
LLLDPAWKSISEEAKAFIKKMLSLDPERRISAKQALVDPWLVHQHKKSPVKKERMLKSLDNLENCTITGHIHKAVLTYISVRTITKTKEDKLRAVFQSLDKNGDGQLSKAELIDGYEKYYGNRELAMKKAKKIMQQIDINKNGLIDYNGKLTAYIFFRVSYC